MRKADLEVGADYRVRGWPEGRARLESLQGTDRHPRTVRMWFYPPDQGGHRYAGPDGTTAYVSPQVIVARWDDPAEIAKREHKAQLDGQAAQARTLLAAFGWTVAQPGLTRTFGSGNPPPESWIESVGDGRVVIRLGAFLREMGKLPSARELLGKAPG